MPRSHAAVLPDGTVLCKPCDARSSQRARTETPDFEVLGMDEEEEPREDEDDDNDDNDDNADPNYLEIRWQASLDQFFNEKET